MINETLSVLPGNCLYSKRFKFKLSYGTVMAANKVTLVNISRRR